MLNFCMPILRPLLGTAMLILFLLQSFSCQAEHSGLLGKTSHHTADSDNCCGSNQDSDSSTPDCHSVCHQPVFLADPSSYVAGPAFKTSFSYFTSNDRCPDGPCATIDLPPLIS